MALAPPDHRPRRNGQDGFTLHAANAGAVVAICRQLDGLVAAVSTLTPAAVLAMTEK